MAETKCKNCGHEHLNILETHCKCGYEFAESMICCPYCARKRKKDLQIINGVQEPCVICGKRTSSTHYIDCTELNLHGKDCHCLLVIGTNCLKKLKQTHNQKRVMNDERQN